MSLRGFCIAMGEDGRRCGRSATNIDVERGGVICDAHRPAYSTPRSRRTPPSDEIDAFPMTVKEATDLAAEDRTADGYAALLVGLRRAAELQVHGEPWGAELVARWQAGLASHVERYGTGQA